jgi:hypothetical protein
MFCSKKCCYFKKYAIITENRVQFETKIGEMERQMTGIYKMIADSVEKINCFI